MIFDESVKTSFDYISDEMPPNRTKAIHSVGYIGKAHWVPTDNAKSKYTGVFKTEGDLLLRMSLAKQAENGNLAPGLSLKFMRDNVQSANMFSLVSLTGIASSEFFDQPFTNNLP